MKYLYMRVTQRAFTHGTLDAKNQKTFGKSLRNAQPKRTWLSATGVSSMEEILANIQGRDTFFKSLLTN